MNKYQQQVAWNLADKGCEKFGFYPFTLTLSDQLMVALYYLNDLIDEVGENTPTGRMWAQWERRIEKFRAELQAA